MKKTRKALLIGLSALSLVTSLTLSAQTEQSTPYLVPIMVGDITIFIPLAAEVIPVPTPVPTPSPEPETPDPVHQ